VREPFREDPVHLLMEAPLLTCSCASILTQNQPGPQDTHGCPFRHSSKQNLQASLWSQYGVGAGETADIMQAVQGGHYHIACTRLFEITHKKKERGGVKKGDGIAPGGETVTHPNRYFERSYVIEKQARDEGLGGDEDEEMHAGPAGAGTSAAAAAMAAVGAVMENTGEED
jgi:DNA primase large subunit